MDGRHRPRKGPEQNPAYRPALPPPRRTGGPVTEGSESKRCPVCGRGTLVDITFREGPNPAGVEEPVQIAESRQVETYSCGHESVGPALDRTAVDDRLEVERREAEDTVDPE